MSVIFHDKAGSLQPLMTLVLGRVMPWQHGCLLWPVVSWHLYQSIYLPRWSMLRQRLAFTLPCSWKAAVNCGEGRIGHLRRVHGFLLLLFPTSCDKDPSTLPWHCSSIHLPACLGPVLPSCNGISPAHPVMLTNRYLCQICHETWDLPGAMYV